MINFLKRLERNNISNIESRTSYMRNGKYVYMKELQYNIATSISYKVNINIVDAKNIWIDYANSYIDTDAFFRLPLSQYHTEDDWNRVYLSNDLIHMDFGNVYSSYNKVAYIVILYTKKEITNFIEGE